ncbi:LysR family transcriptional regulator [Hydrogenophaga sp. OTU3427]|uniref:LysR family transcriptional regulator n=1 Tax=Hydrogenophaga sp. OTU3427 TaxID=3043856 RepID=UPI00313E8F78
MNQKALPTVRQLQAFLAVYRLRKLSAAAAQLFVTQSAVSVLIRQLEEGLGVRLFERTTRALQPTQAAQEAAVLAERILRDVGALSSGFRDLRELRRGQVSVVITPTLAGMLMPRIVQAFRADHPDIVLRVDDCAPDQFLSRIVGEHVDFGIGTPEHAANAVNQQTLLRDHLALVCLPDHPLAKARRVRWADLEGHNVITGRPGYGVRRLVDLSAAQAGVSLRVVNEVSFQSTSLWMTACGLAPCIMPSAYALQSAYRDQLVVKVLQEPRVSRDIYIVTKRDRHLSPACEAFIAAARGSLKGAW